MFCLVLFNTIIKRNFLFIQRITQIEFLVKSINYWKKHRKGKMRNIIIKKDFKVSPLEPLHRKEFRTKELKTILDCLVSISCVA